MWGADAADAAGFLLGTGPGGALPAGADEAQRRHAHTALTEHLHAREAADGSVRLLAKAWLVTAEAPAQAGSSDTAASRIAPAVVDGS